MPSEQHQAVVRRLVDLGALTHDFKQSLLKAIVRDSDQETANVLKVELAEASVTPDAYQIDQEGCVVTVFEVEMHSTLDKEKLDKYIRYWWLLDDLSWVLRIVIVKCLANVGICYEIDLRDVVYATESSNPVIALSISRNNCSLTVVKDAITPLASG
jgi:hypothetical protein